MQFLTKENKSTNQMEKSKNAILKPGGVLSIRRMKFGTSLVGQGLSFDASHAGGMSLIPDQGTKIPTCCTWPGKINKCK